jgi:hypothetical protein
MTTMADRKARVFPVEIGYLTHNNFLIDTGRNSEQDGHVKGTRSSVLEPSS